MKRLTILAVVVGLLPLGTSAVVFAEPSEISKEQVESFSMSLQEAQAPNAAAQAMAHQTLVQQAVAAFHAESSDPKVALADRPVAPLPPGFSPVPEENVVSPAPEPEPATEPEPEGEGSTIPEIPESEIPVPEAEGSPYVPDPETVRLIAEIYGTIYPFLVDLVDALDGNSESLITPEQAIIIANLYEAIHPFLEPPAEAAVGYWHYDGTTRTWTWVEGVMEGSDPEEGGVPLPPEAGVDPLPPLPDPPGPDEGSIMEAPAPPEEAPLPPEEVVVGSSDDMMIAP